MLVPEKKLANLTESKKENKSEICSFSLRLRSFIWNTGEARNPVEVIKKTSTFHRCGFCWFFYFHTIFDLCLIQLSLRDLEVAELTAEDMPAI